MKRLISILSVLLAVALSAACSKDGINSITIDEELVDGTLRMYPGQSRFLNVILDPADADEDLLKVTSSDSSVVRPSDLRLNAVKAGNAVVTVSSPLGKARASLKVKVLEVDITSFELSASSLSLRPGESGTIQVKDIQPAVATAACLNCSMNPSGAHFGVKFEGSNIVITAGWDADAGEKATLTFSNLSGSVSKSVNVSTSDVTVTLDKTSASLMIGETLQLNATANPDAYGITWSSDKPAVATVSSTGLVTAVSDGTANIKATAGGKSRTCAVTVKGGNFSFKIIACSSQDGGGPVQEGKDVSMMPINNMNLPWSRDGGKAFLGDKWVYLKFVDNDGAPLNAAMVESLKITVTASDGRSLDGDTFDGPSYYLERNFSSSAVCQARFCPMLFELQTITATYQPLGKSCSIKVDAVKPTRINYYAYAYNDSSPDVWMTTARQVASVTMSVPAEIRRSVVAANKYIYLAVAGNLGAYVPVSNITIPLWGFITTLSYKPSGSTSSWNVRAYDCQKVVEQADLGVEGFSPSFHVSMNYSSESSMWIHRLNVVK